MSRGISIVEVPLRRNQSVWIWFCDGCMNRSTARWDTPAEARADAQRHQCPRGAA